MEEFGDGFFEESSDDDKDTNNENHINGSRNEIQATKNYIPKQCTSEWFKNIKVDKDSTLEQYTEYKYEADLLYYQHDYQGACEKYRKLIDFTHNKPTLRELYESCCRCAVKMDRFEDAECYLQRLIELHANSNDPSVHVLAHQIYKSLGHVERSLHHIVNAINVNVTYPRFWLDFYDALKSFNPHGGVVTISSCEYEVTDQLLCSVLLQARFFLNECLRGQPEGRISHFCAMRDELEGKMDMLGRRDASLAEILKKGIVATGLEETDGENAWIMENFISRWLHQVQQKLLSP